MTRAWLVLPLLLLPACGGDDGTDAKAEFVAKAEAVCATAKAERAKNPQPTSVRALPGYVETLVDIADRAHRDLSALELPPDDAADLRSRLLDPLGRDVEANRTLVVRMKASSSDGGRLLALLSQRPKPTVDVAYAEEYGLPTCAEAAR